MVAEPPALRLDRPMLAIARSGRPMLTSTLCPGQGCGASQDASVRYRDEEPQPHPPAPPAERVLSEEERETLRKCFAMIDKEWA